MKYIFVKELQSLFNSVFYAFLIVILLISVFSGLISSYNYNSLNGQKKYLQNKYEEELLSVCSKSLESVAFMNHLVLQENNPISFLAGDQASKYPDQANILIPKFYFGKKSETYNFNKTTDNVLSFLPFIRYDLLFIVEVILSFMVIVVTYDSISREKEHKTLALILSNNISRTSILIGKICAYMLMALFSIIIGVIVQLITIVLVGSIPVSLSIINQLIIFLLFSFIYLCFWCILSVCISAISKTSSISLTYLIIIWIAFIFIIPSSGSIFLKNKEKQLPSSEKILANYEKIEKELSEEAENANAAWRGGNLKANEQDNHIKERNLSPIYLKYLDVMEKYQYNIINNQIGQLNFLYNYSSISSSFLYRRIIESFSNIEPLSFLSDVRQYRKDLMTTIISLDKEDEKSMHLPFFYHYMSKERISREQIPQFYETKKIYKNVGQNLVFIILFLIEIILLFVLCQYFFSKSDVR